VITISRSAELFALAAMASMPLSFLLLRLKLAEIDHRYAHLVDDPLRAATETAGAVIAGGKSAKVARIGGR
jgi:hypothetical protein